MSSIGSRLKESREKKGLLQSELAKLIGVKSAGVISNWEKDINKPNADKMVEICQVLDISLSYLLNYYGEQKAPPYSSEACKLAEDFDKKLDSWGKKAVRELADVEIARCEAEQAEEKAAAVHEQREQAEAGKLVDFEKVLRYTVSGYTMPMSAGTGQEAGQEYPEDYTLVKAPPRGTSYIAPVNGVSMKPTYQDGDLVFVHSCEEIRVGQIGVFFMDGQQWIKELGDGALISHNPDYDPIPMRDDIRCQGHVLGVCDESYFE